MDDQLRTFRVRSRSFTPSFVFWRVAANSAAVKPPEKLTGVAGDVLQRSDTAFDTSRADSRSAPLYFSFPRSCRF